MYLLQLLHGQFTQNEHQNYHTYTQSERFVARRHPEVQPKMFTTLYYLTLYPRAYMDTMNMYIYSNGMYINEVIKGSIFMLNLTNSHYNNMRNVRIAKSHIN